MNSLLLETSVIHLSVFYPLLSMPFETSSVLALRAFAVFSVNLRLTLFL